MHVRCAVVKYKGSTNTVGMTAQIILNSMHRYQPRIYVVESRDVNTTSSTTSFDGLSTFVFAETQFIAVTAYQNDKVYACSVLSAAKRSTAFSSSMNI